VKRSRIRKRNPERLERLRAKQFGPQADLCRSLPCVVCGVSPSDPAHVRSRGAGGTDADTVPLCRTHHQEQHQIGLRSFERLHGLDLELVARSLRATIESEDQ
jgi:hypothetical protein